VTATLPSDTHSVDDTGHTTDHNDLVDCVSAITGSSPGDSVTVQKTMNTLAGAVTSGDYLRGNGTNVVMAAIEAADLPAGTTSAKGALQLDGTAGHIQPVGTQAAGSNGLAADSGHVHGLGTAAPSASPQFTGNQPTFTDAAGLALTAEGSQASITSPVSLTTSSETVLAGLTLPASDPAAGAVYKLTAFGYFTTDSTSGTVTITATFGGTSLCSIALAPTVSLTNSFWQAELIVTFVTATTCNASLKYIHNTAGTAGWASNVNLSGTASAASVTVTGTPEIAIQGTNAATAHVTFVCTGSVPERKW
jgi:hypothetical protein